MNFVCVPSGAVNVPRVKVAAAMHGNQRDVDTDLIIRGIEHLYSAQGNGTSRTSLQHLPGRVACEGRYIGPAPIRRREKP